MKSTCCIVAVITTAVIIVSSGAVLFGGYDDRDECLLNELKELRNSKHGGPLWVSDRYCKRYPERN